jgi:hypothetical protein
MSEERMVIIRGSDTVRKELQERFSKAGIPCQEVSRATLSVDSGLTVAMLWVTLKVVKQLTPILFEFKRTKRGTSFRVCVGKGPENTREIPVQNERDFEAAVEEGIQEISITDDERDGSA